MGTATDGHASRTALRFVLLVGVLSFFGDFTYEGARSITGPFLASLQASATVVGIVLGVGELLGYGLRLVSGRLADATGQFWPITITGYIVQMTAVPALALAHSWPVAAALIIVERMGKAIRNPPRDVMLSYAGRHIGGYGWAFGIHEAFDQTGALIGPLVISYVLQHEGQYSQAFAVLLVPAAFNLLFVAIARLSFPRPGDFQGTSQPPTEEVTSSHTFWIYLAGAALVAAGFADWGLIAFHFSKTGAAPVQSIAIMYSIAMAMSGGSSLLFGRLFDRFGFRVLIGLTLVTAAFAPLVFYGNFPALLAGAALWGMGMGVHESIIPAAVTTIVPHAKRASAFGLFTAGYGVSWFIGSAVIGFLYDRSTAATVVFCLVTQLAAIPLFVVVASQLRQRARS